MATDCLRIIFSLLEVKEIINCSSCNKLFLSISNDENIWKNLCLKNFKILPEVITISWKKLYIIQHKGDLFNKRRCNNFLLCIYTPTTLSLKFNEEVQIIKDSRCDSILRESEKNGSVKMSNIGFINEYLDKKKIRERLRNGDCVTLEGLGNSLNLMFREGKLVPFSLTSNQIFSEFPISYWERVCTRKLIPFDPTNFIGEMIRNQKVTTGNWINRIETHFTRKHYVYFVDVILPKTVEDLSRINYEKMYKEEEYCFISSHKMVEDIFPRVLVITPPSYLFEKKYMMDA